MMCIMPIHYYQQILQISNICDALRDLVPFVQFKKSEKHPWRSVTFSKVAVKKSATLLKVTIRHGCFSRFFKLYKWHQIEQNITY